MATPSKVLKDITKTQCEKWLENPHINPLSQKSINTRDTLNKLINNCKLHGIELTDEKKQELETLLFYNYSSQTCDNELLKELINEIVNNFEKKGDFEITIDSQVFTIKNPNYPSVENKFKNCDPAKYMLLRYLLRFINNYLINFNRTTPTFKNKNRLVDIYEIDEVQLYLKDNFEHYLKLFSISAKCFSFDILRNVPTVDSKNIIPIMMPYGVVINGCDEQILDFVLNVLENMNDYDLNSDFIKNYLEYDSRLKFLMFNKYFLISSEELKDLLNDQDFYLPIEMSFISNSSDEIKIVFRSELIKINDNKFINLLLLSCKVLSNSFKNYLVASSISQIDKIQISIKFKLFRELIKDLYNQFELANKYHTTIFPDDKDKLINLKLFRKYIREFTDIKTPSIRSKLSPIKDIKPCETSKECLTSFKNVKNINIKVALAKMCKLSNKFPLTYDRGSEIKTEIKKNTILLSRNFWDDGEDERFTINRNRLPDNKFESALNLIFQEWKGNEMIFKNTLESFTIIQGEGIDAGGLKKEFFDDALRELAASNYFDSNDECTFIPKISKIKKLPSLNDEIHKKEISRYYRFIGELIAFSLLHDFTISMHLSKGILQHLLKPNILEIENLFWLLSDVPASKDYVNKKLENSTKHEDLLIKELSDYYIDTFYLDLKTNIYLSNFIKGFNLIIPKVYLKQCGVHISNIDYLLSCTDINTQLIIEQVEKNAIIPKSYQHDPRWLFFKDLLYSKDNAFYYKWVSDLLNTSSAPFIRDNKFLQLFNQQNSAKSSASKKTLINSLHPTIQELLLKNDKLITGHKAFAILLNKFWTGCSKYSPSLTYKIHINPIINKGGAEFEAHTCFDSIDFNLLCNNDEQRLIFIRSLLFIIYNGLIEGFNAA